MASTTKTSRTTRRCKIKRVNPAFRSVSTPRRIRDLRSADRVNGETAVAPDCGSEWSARALCRRLQNELPARLWRRLRSAVAERGTTVEALLQASLGGA
jgi:hypothetical protein